ncbi:MAG TPA: GNAT family N-acetyltransferase [Pelagibacterium sp.]|uniref:GNAT family N-acetyltransferase n=1 Tax=uncultured Pelagibacterium sp. TaxID=1159875 RepID=UPI000C4AA210|nr:GNAT family N-acetyltransferase [Pelagibacterium sp.]HCO55148.1 GNAT family N-acetyltransferase [Pelagibacterium sp.]|tara:strand:- start:205 stop:642 length:438 start_codon:yes stop_codon:yes gene_type:complete
MEQSNLTLLAVPVFSPLCNLGFALRREVFVIEQHVPEDLEHDADDMTATHIVGIAEGAVVAVARILFKPEHAKIGRVAIAASHRGKKLGARLIEFAVQLAGENGQPRCYLESQADKTGFYARLGFMAYGDQFMDAGIPHLKMKNY